MRLRGANRNFRRVSNQQVPFNPMKLFRNGEQGVHYDPSDFSRYMQTGPELVMGTWQTPVGYDNITTGSGSSFSTTGAGSPSRVAQVVTTVATPGRPYRVSFRVVSTTAAVSLFVRDGTVEGSGTILATTNAVVGSIQTLSFFAASAAVNLLFTTGVAANYSIDNISVRELTALDSCTLFQDSAGTTPVTAVEQPVGLMLDKRLGTARGPELRSTGTVFSLGTSTIANYNTTTGQGSAWWVDAPNQSGVQFAAGIGVFYILTITVHSGSIGIRNGRIDGPVWATVNPGTTTVRVPGGGTGLISITSGVGGESAFTLTSIKEIPGNHAFQTTAIDRPVLRNRYNLLTKTEQFDDAAWGKSNYLSVLPVSHINPLGGNTAHLAIPNTASSAKTIDREDAFPASSVKTIYAKSAGYRYLQLNYGMVYSGSYANFDLQNGTVTAQVGGSASIIDAGNGWWLLSFTTTGTANTTRHGFTIVQNPSSGRAEAMTGDGTSGIYIWGASLVPADQAHLPYQRVNTSTDYDADPTKFPLYLAANGTNTWMQTNSIDFTGTVKVTFFAGLRKLSDAAPGIPFELSITSFSNNGAFTLIAPPVAGSPLYRVALRGTATYIETSSSNSYPAPRSDVLSISLLIPGPTRTSLRINGALAATNNSSAGTGNFGNYPLYLFRRAGSQFPFNGNFYGLVIRGATTSDPDTLKMERWLSLKTGVQL